MAFARTGTPEPQIQTFELKRTDGDSKKASEKEKEKDERKK
jgi:hypothetical protein